MIQNFLQENLEKLMVFSTSGLNCFEENLTQFAKAGFDAGVRNVVCGKVFQVL